jgi:acetylornithine deacetylase/succinyl-diaminopimelate desuccinylase-like protein
MDQRTLNLCRRLIAIRSVTAEGTREIAEFCAREILEPAGIEARLLASAHEGAAQVNLVARVPGRDSSLAPLVFNTHLDTVPPGNSALWTECGGDPFGATVRDDRIYGLGAADTKLDFAAKATALIAARAPRRDVVLIGTFGEEHGLAGAKEIAGSTTVLPRGALAFVGEPSGLQVITAHKGLMAYRAAFAFDPVRIDPPVAIATVAFTGRAAHSSTPALGINAIAAALYALSSHPKVRVASIAGGTAVNVVPAHCEAIVAGELAHTLGAGARSGGDCGEFIPAEVIAALSQFIAALAEFASRTGPAEPDYAPPTLTWNPGVIGTAADSVTLDFELRPPPSLALDAVRRGVDEIAKRLTAGAPNVDISLSELRANPGFRSPAESETVELAIAALARAGLTPKTGVKAGCTEAGIYAGAGLVPVVIGPGPSVGVIHAPNEYNLLAEVDGAIRFYRALLEL